MTSDQQAKSPSISATGHWGLTMPPAKLHQKEQERQQYLAAAVPPYNRRHCGDYTTLAERIAERDGEAARVAALNREMRRQMRSERPLSYWLQRAGIAIYLAAGIAAFIWGLRGS